MYWLLSKPLPEFPTLSGSFLVSCWDSCALYFCVIFFFSCGSLAEYPQLFLEFLSVHSYCSIESVSLVIVPGKWLSLLKCPLKPSKGYPPYLIIQNYSYSGKDMRIAHENVQKWTIIPYKWRNVSLTIRILVEKWLQYKSGCHKVWWAYSIFSLLFYFVWPCYFELVDEVGSGVATVEETALQLVPGLLWIAHTVDFHDEWLVPQDVLQGSTML